MNKVIKVRRIVKKVDVTIREKYNKKSEELWAMMGEVTEDGIEPLDCEVIDEVVRRQLILSLSGVENAFVGDNGDE